MSGSKPSYQHTVRPKGIPGLWVELTMADGSAVDGMIETTDLRQITPWQKITLRFGSVTREFKRSEYVGVKALGVMGSGSWSDNLRTRRVKK